MEEDDLVILTENIFSQPDANRTLALEVQGITFWVSRETLAMYSPVFNAMLYGHFEEAQKEKIELPGKKAQEIYELLLCLMPMPHTKDIDHSNYELILALSDEYQMEDLKHRAEPFLILEMQQYKHGDEKLMQSLLLASKYKLRRLLAICIKRCAMEIRIDRLVSIYKTTSPRCDGGFKRVFGQRPV